MGELVGCSKGKVAQVGRCLGGLCPGAAGDPEEGFKGSWRGLVWGGSVSGCSFWVVREVSEGGVSWVQELRGLWSSDVVLGQLWPWLALIH